MTWDAPLQTHANLGWIQEGEGLFWMIADIARDRVIGKSKRVN